MTEDYSEGSVYEKFIIKNKEYYVIAIRFTADKGGEVLICSEYLYQPIWLPMLGLEITDNFIPTSWKCNVFITEIGKGICYCSNRFNISRLNNGYTALYDNLYCIIAEEIKELEKLSRENNQSNPVTLENKMTIHMKELGLEKFTPHVYKKIEPSKNQLYKIAVDIEDYLIKDKNVNWYFFTDDIKQKSLSEINDVDLASDILKYYGGPDSFSEVYISDMNLKDQDFYKINNEFGILKDKLQYCCEYIIAKHEYMDLFESPSKSE